MNSLRKRNRTWQAFTLIELLIVLGILAMLMALVAPRVMRSGEKANIKKAQVDIAAFHEVLKLYKLDMRKFPRTEQGIAALWKEPEDLGGNSQWDGPYGDHDEPPADPWGNAYQYEWPSSHGKRGYPDIWSIGPDEEDGTDDDIVNWKKDGGGEGDDLGDDDLGGGDIGGDTGGGADVDLGGGDDL